MSTWLDRVTTSSRLTVKPLEWLPLEYLCFNLRQSDRDEIFNNLPVTNGLEVTAMIMQAVAKNGVGWVASLDGRPAACLGVSENWKGNFQIFSFGTDNYHRAAVAFKPRFDEALDYAKNKGGIRVECRSRFNHGSAHRLLKAMDFKVEGVLERYGADGSDYLQFARLI